MLRVLAYAHKMNRHKQNYYKKLSRKYITDNMIEDTDNIKKRIVWVDCEMTGLDIKTCHLLEVACLITDENLNIIAEGPNIVINQPEDIMEKMNAWCVKQHNLSGLVDRVRESKIGVKQAEIELLSFVRQYTQPRMCPIAGNSVHVDKIFLEKYMPEFTNHFQYRIIDVSTIKELAKRWYPPSFAPPAKKSNHRALDDIKESIAELAFYRENLFIKLE